MTDTDSSTVGTFARSSGLPPEMGKCTERVVTLLPDCVRTDLLKLCGSLGMSEGELLREWVMVRLYGEEQVRMMYARRVSLVAGTSTERTPA